MPHRQQQTKSGSHALSPKAGVISSPCCKKCHLLPDNTCGGCGRSLQEIAMWGSMTDEQRLAVRARIEARRGQEV
ncbi:MAG: DUF1289 domain-containing protein [bacterium]